MIDVLEDILACVVWVFQLPPGTQWRLPDLLLKVINYHILSEQQFGILESDWWDVNFPSEMFSWYFWKESPLSELCIGHFKVSDMGKFSGRKHFRFLCNIKGCIQNRCWISFKNLLKIWPAMWFYSKTVIWIWQNGEFCSTKYKAFVSFVEMCF